MTIHSAPAHRVASLPAAASGATVGPSAVDVAMDRALDLAARGPATGANPRVGCVLLSPTGDVIAEGWHRGVGTPHAEVDALTRLASVRGTDVARGATAVVSLEPCDHTGRTGPCSQALIDAGVARVIYTVDDPGRTSGGGAARLRAAGVEVVAGIRAEAAEAFLRVWLTSARLGRPFVTVKWASTLDGRAAASDGSSQWITGGAARWDVHARRRLADAIAVGTGTVLTDDPRLTARGDDDSSGAVQPVPVVIGRRAIPPEARVRAHPRGLIETGTRDIDAVLRELDGRGIRHLFVEGGPTLASAFVAAGLVDEYLVYLAPALLGGPGLALGDIGVDTIADARRLAIDSVDRLGDDLLVVARPQARPTSAEGRH
ncbi:MAG: bifunctional diaminohydroxyphosphoribosylaminopyrimidine [Actinomycetota bacterium]